MSCTCLFFGTSGMRSHGRGKQTKAQKKPPVTEQLLIFNINKAYILLLTQY